MEGFYQLLSEIRKCSFDMVPFRAVAKLKNGSDYKSFGEGQISVFGSGGVIAKIDHSVYEKPSVLIPRKGSLGNLFYVEKPFWTVDTIYYTEIKESLILPKFLFYYLKTCHLERMNFAGGVPSLTQKMIEQVVIPLMPIELQKKIVDFLDSIFPFSSSLVEQLEKELILRKQESNLILLNSFEKPSEDVASLSLREIGPICMCKRILKSQTNKNGGVPFFKIGTFGLQPDAFISSELFNLYKGKYHYPRAGEVLVSAAGTIGKCVIFDGKPSYFQDSNIVWLENREERVLNRYLFYFYKTNPWKITAGGTIPRLYNNDFLNTKIAVPSKARQVSMVSFLDSFFSAEDSLLRSIKKEINFRNLQFEHLLDLIFSKEGENKNG
jgi:type I restriction enzyme S subunit